MDDQKLEDIALEDLRKGTEALLVAWNDIHRVRAQDMLRESPVGRLANRSIMQLEDSIYADIEKLMNVIGAVEEHFNE